MIVEYQWSQHHRPSKASSMEILFLFLLKLPLACFPTHLPIPDLAQCAIPAYTWGKVGMAPSHLQFRGYPFRLSAEERYCRVHELRLNCSWDWTAAWLWYPPMTFWSPYLVPRQWLTLPCVWCPATPARQWLSSLVLTSLLVKKLWLRSLRLFFRHLTFKQYKLKTARVWTFPSLVCCVYIFHYCTRRQMSH